VTKAFAGDAELLARFSETFRIEPAGPPQGAADAAVA